MNLKVLSLAGLGVLGAGAAGAIGIAASSGGGEKESEEIAKPSPIPTISQKLSDKGYIYNPPKLSHHGTLVQSCTENLLNKKGLDNAKLYGCGMAKMDLWDSEDQFRSEKVDYLQFASEIFIRKGNEGWRINTRVDNHSSGVLIYQHLLTYYKKGNSKGLEIEESFLINIENDEPLSKIKKIAFPGKSVDNGFFVEVATKKLNIRVPNETNSWYQKNNYLTWKTPLADAPSLTKVHRETKTWSGIWIDESQPNKPRMFQDIEVFVGDMTYSQVFCKNQTCGAGSTNMLYKLNRSQGSFTAPSVWWETTDKFLKQNAEAFNNTSEPRKSILKFIEGSQGEWVNADNFCKSGSELETEISDEELEKLRLYCSKSKN